jgi:uncharacterized protein YjbJ (UPF0337 family)
MALEKKIRDRMQMWRGRAKSELGKAIGSKDLHHDGMRDEVMGSVKHTMERVRNALKR